MKQQISLHKIEEIQQYIAGYSLEDRINVLMLNPDRADVIVPASDIYIKVMDWVQAKYIQVPEVGLKDGIMLHLYRKNSKSKKVSFTNTEDQSKGRKIIKMK